MDRNPGQVTAAEFAVYQPGMNALSVRTQARSFSSLNSVAGAGGAHGVDLVGLGVVVGALLVLAHLMRGKK